MPVPKPHAGESRSEFVSRCMSDESMLEYPRKQRTAICFKSWRDNPHNMSSDLQIRAHISRVHVDKSLLRSDKLNGRDCIVAPVVCIVEGVHNEEYVAYEEIAAFPDAWSGRPLPIDHPTGPKGEPLTANTPKVMENSVVGVLFNVVARDDIKGVSGEIWIDIEKSATVPGGKEALELLQSGKGLEVSTGYFTYVDNIPGEWLNPKTGEVEKYKTSQYGIRPDHLALLPFDTGACSWKDGCGAPRMNADHAVNLESTMNKDKFAANILSTARRPSFSGTESVSWASVSKSFNAYAKAYVKSSGGSVPSSVSDATAGMKKWIASKTLLGDAEASTNRDLIFFPVVNPGTGNLNEGALRAVIGGRGSQANIPAEALSSAQDMARNLLKSEFGVDLKENTKLTANGQQLGIALAGALEVFTLESGESDLLDRLAAAVGTDDATMQAIVAGELDFIPRRWINIFAAILDIDPYELYMACSNDNSYARYYQDSAANTFVAKKVGSDDAQPVAISHTNAEPSDAGTCEPCQKSLKEKVLGILATVGITTTKEKGDMADTKQTKVEALIASDKTQFNASHRDWLMTLTDEQLVLLEPKAEPVTTQVAVSVQEPVVEPKAVEVRQVATMTREHILQTLGVSEEALLATQAAVSDRKAARERRIAEITSNAQCPYQKADLDAMSDAMLEKTAQMFDASPFRIAIGARQMTSSDVIPPTPSIMTAPAGVRGVDFAKPDYRGAK